MFSNHKSVIMITEEEVEEEVNISSCSSSNSTLKINAKVPMHKKRMTTFSTHIPKVH
jgi:hypothetical protein